MNCVQLAWSQNYVCSHVSLLYAFCYSALLPRPNAALTSLPDKEPLKEDAVPLPSVAAAVKDDLPPLGGVDAEEKEAPMDNKAMQENLAEDKDMELLDAHEEDDHSDSKDSALLRLQNLI